MRPGRTPALLAALATVALMAAALPVVAQDYEELERPPLEDPLEGFTRSDGTVVLKDADFCSYLLGSIWGDEQLTFSRLIDKSKKQKKARKGAFAPASDEAVLQQCADVLNAFRLEQPEDSPLAAWARSSPVVPEALAGLLPADLVSNPLAVPDPIGDGSRTTGFGDLFSAPFGLTGGTYLVSVDDRACDSWVGMIRGAGDPSLEFGPVDGRAYLYDVEAANYYWDVEAPDCDWSVDLVTVELPPDPTPTPEPRAVVPKLHGDGWGRSQGYDNSAYLTPFDARQAVLDAGLTTGECVQEAHKPVAAGRVYRQTPAAGTLLPLGSPVDVIATTDCDIYVGDRIPVE